MRRVTGQRRFPVRAIAFGLAAMACLETGMLDRRDSLFAAEDSGKTAATVDEAIKVLDLRTYTLPAGTVVESAPQVGNVGFTMAADPKKVLQLQQQQLAKLGWKELPGTKAEATYGSAQFQKANFVLAVMTSASDKPDRSRVSIINFGNLRPSGLPVIKGAKSLFANEATAMHVVDAKVADATAATRKLLVDAGWEPYGSAGNLPALHGGLSVSRPGVLVTAFGPHPDGPGALLRVWDQTGAAGKLVMTLPKGLRASKATPVNLRGERAGDILVIDNSTLTINLGAHSPASFVLE